MPSPEIQEFAKLFIQHVRDGAIRSCDKCLRADAKDVIALRLKEILATEKDCESVVKTLIPMIVDSALAQVLWAIDQELLQLTFTASSGKSVNLPTEGGGELEGCTRVTKDGAQGTQKSDSLTISRISSWVIGRCGVFSRISSCNYGDSPNRVTSMPTVS